MAGSKNRLSSLDLVPEDAQDDIVWAIGELNQRTRTQAEILLDLNARLALKGVEPISSSAFNRKAVKLRAVQIRLDEARYIFTGIADQFTPEKVDDNSIVLGEFIKMLVFELTQADASERTPKMAMELARAFHDTVKGQAMSAARRSKLESEFKEKAGAALASVAKKAGLSAERVEELRGEFLNLADKPR
ncbi:phage protein Gp27 family protein [Bosea vestrisii]|uniref:Phage protein Gp27 family protein n=1 Tax=Bosea vestrisii TaxID=151416 RepID=A0ABW0H7B7_9HYPH